MMGDNIEADLRTIHRDDVTTRFLAGSQIEVVGGFTPRRPPTHVLFDFDGTLSLIREGWPEVMVPMMVDHLRRTGSDESAEELRQMCKTFIADLTGKQTVYQMIRLAEEIRARRGNPLEPNAYKREYHELLMRRIEDRREKLRSGSVAAERWLVPGSRALLDELQRRGAQLYLASGTDEVYVREEVELLGLNEYFGERVFGAQEDVNAFSKAQVIERMLTDNQLEGASLLGFGDGYVEIQNVRDAGGTAVAVASDEAGRSGEPDAWKRSRLIAAGAHAVVPDFAESARLVQWLWGEQ